MQFLQLFLILSILLLGLDSQAQPFVDEKTGSEVRVLKADEIPRFLYSWTTPESLLKRSQEVQTSGTWPGFASLRQMPMVIVRNWPQVELAPQGGLFAWSNANAVTGGSLYERYGDVLVRFEVDPSKLRGLLLKTGGRGRLGEPAYNGAIDLSQVDVIFHQASGFSEWVLLNPKAFVHVTADPAVMKEELQRQIENLRGDHKFLADEIHFNPYLDPYNPQGNKLFEPEARSYAVYRLTRFLEEGREIVPDMYLARPTGKTEATLRKNIRAFKIKDFELYRKEVLASRVDKMEFSMWTYRDLLINLLAVRLAEVYSREDMAGERLISMNQFEGIIIRLTQGMSHLLLYNSAEAEFKKLYKKLEDPGQDPRAILAELYNHSKAKEPRSFIEKKVPEMASFLGSRLCKNVAGQ